MTDVAVPTWNYVTVHVYGLPKIMETEEELNAVLDETVKAHESGFPNPWTTSRLPDEVRAKLNQAIVGFEIEITRVEAKLKLGQNRSQEDQAKMLQTLQNSGDAESIRLAELMKRDFQNQTFMIDYNAASKSYDNTRNASEALIALFHKAVRFSGASVVLDFGCGTGNYLHLIQTLYGCQCHGVEPSDGMRIKVNEKNPVLIIEQGNHSHIPYPDSFFDFAYMTDVIHHVPDLGQMFQTIRRVLKPQGKLCIVTESHPQIEARFYNRYFPSLAKNEKQRYPDVQDIVHVAEDTGFQLNFVEIRPASISAAVSASLIRTVEEKNFSMFRLLSNEEHSSGLDRLKNDLGAVYETDGAGDSLI